MPRWNSLMAAFVIAVVLAGGWTAAVLMLGRVLQEGFVGEFSEHRIFFGFLTHGGLALLPATPAVAAWIAARQNWTAVAWILGILAAVLTILVGIWMIRNADT